jgi:hypothetical protein
VTGNGLYKGVESAEVEMKNWPQVKELILSSYGLTDVPEISFDAIQPVGHPDNPDIYQVDVNNVNLIAIMGEPAPPGLFPQLPRLFPDLTEEDIRTYTGGMVITAVTLPGQPAKVDIILLNETGNLPEVAAPNALTGVQFEDTFGLYFPDDTIRMNATSAENIELITVISPDGVEETAASIVSQMERDGIEPIVRADEKDGSIGAENDKGVISITLLSVDGEPDTVVQMRIRKKE